MAEAKRTYYATSPRAKVLKAAAGRRHKYGVTAAEYEARLRAQAGVCAICRRPERLVRKGRPMPLCVDHDHRTGEVRGLLCHGCNFLLGLAAENPRHLEAALAYLRTSDRAAEQW